MNNISVEELKSRMDKGEKLNLIDVRESWEYEDFNIGARNIPLSEFVNHLGELEKLKNQEVIIHCQMGGRSMQAATLLEQQGFRNVKNVEGGMNEWRAKFNESPQGKK